MATRRWRKLGIIACGGALPIELARYCASMAEPYHMIRFAGIADPECQKHPGTDCNLVEAGKVFRTLRDENCDAIVMAGMMKRPNFSTLRPDWRGTALLAKLSTAAINGDGAILKALVDIFEAEGFLVIGAEEVLTNIGAECGALGKYHPIESDFSDIRKAAKLIKAIGPFDVGQGAVVSQGQVLAIEAAEGTDAMLQRCRPLQERMSITLPSGVLVKIPKPGQELRVDLPTIGVETVHQAAIVGLRGIAFLSEAIIILDKEEMLNLADEREIFVYACIAEELRDERP